MAILKVNITVDVEMDGTDDDPDTLKDFTDQLKRFLINQQYVPINVLTDLEVYT